MLKDVTKPAPFAETALLLEHTTTFAICGLVYAAAGQSNTETNVLQCEVFSCLPSSD